MKKYKLIKQYPNSPELGQTVTQTGGGNYIVDGFTSYLSADVIENNPEFWSECRVSKIMQDGVIVEVIRKDGEHFKVGDFVEHKNDPKDFGRIHSFTDTGSFVTVSYGDTSVNRPDLDLNIIRQETYVNAVDVIKHSTQQFETAAESIERIDEESESIEENYESVYFREFVDFNTGRFTTICLNIISPREFHFGWAICNPEDKYDKYLGRTIAEGRAICLRTRKVFIRQEGMPDEIFNEQRLMEISQELVDNLYKLFENK